MADISSDMSSINLSIQVPALGQTLASLRRVETELASMNQTQRAMKTEFESINQKQQALKTEFESLKALVETFNSAVAAFGQDSPHAPQADDYIHSVHATEHASFDDDDLAPSTDESITDNRTTLANQNFASSRPLAPSHDSSDIGFTPDDDHTLSNHSGPRAVFKQRSEKRRVADKLNEDQEVDRARILKRPRSSMNSEDLFIDDSQSDVEGFRVHDSAAQIAQQARLDGLSNFIHDPDDDFLEANNHVDDEALGGLDDDSQTENVVAWAESPFDKTSPKPSMPPPSRRNTNRSRNNSSTRTPRQPSTASTVSPHIEPQEPLKHSKTGRPLRTTQQVPGYVQTPKYGEIARLGRQRKSKK